MASLFVSLSIWRCPSKFMNVTMWEHCTFYIRFMDVAKFTHFQMFILTVTVSGGSDLLLLITEIVQHINSVNKR
jgi:hypothetical protein